MGHDTDTRHHKSGISHGSFLNPTYKLLFPELEKLVSGVAPHCPGTAITGHFVTSDLSASKYTCENIDIHQNMTKSKRMFAEMLVQARGYGDADEIAKTMSLVDIIYEMKKEELKTAEPPSVEEPVEEKKPEPEAPPPVVEDEPTVIVKIKDFWSRLTHDSDTD